MGHKVLICIIQRVQPLDNHQDRYAQMIHPSHCCYVTEDGSGEEDSEDDNEEVTEEDLITLSLVSSVVYSCSTKLVWCVHCI